MLNQKAIILLLSGDHVVAATDKKSMRASGYIKNRVDVVAY